MERADDVLVEFGDTKVLCTASIEEKVPPHQRGTGRGWVTAEYGMLPRATHTRSDREAARGKQSGRTQEIQRTQDVTIQALASLAETRDNETGSHIRRTQHYVLALAETL